MGLYQGEDIVLRIKGDDVVDFISNNFWLLYYPKGRSSNSKTVSKGSFKQIDGENVYEYAIPYSETSKMQGSYNIEILIQEAGGKRSIYVQENAFYVECSNIKDETLE